MGILNRLWAPIWDREQAKKAEKSYNLYQVESAKLAKSIKDMENEPSEVQKEALKMGPVEGTSTYDDYVRTTNQLAMIYAQNSLAQQAHKQQSSNTVLSGVGVPTYGGGLLQPGTAQNSIATSNVFPVTAGNITQNTVRWPTLGTGERDTFFMALKGIEEASMKSPEGNSPYDEDAYAIQDLRYFDAQKIDLLGILSFCIANVIDAHGIVTLLEGHGMKLVVE